jgi:hypothetical protein
MPPRTKSGADYELVKDKLLDLYLKRKSDQEIANELKISRATAWAWRKRLIRERGRLTTRKMKRILEEWTVKSLGEGEIQKIQSLATITNPNLAPCDRTSANGNLSKTHLKELEILKHLGILKTQEIKISSSDRLELTIVPPKADNDEDEGAQERRTVKIPAPKETEA